MAAGKKKLKISSTQKKSATKKGTASRKKQAQNGEMRLEMVTLFTVVAGLLLGIFMYLPSGFLSEWIRAFLLGVLGFPAYLLPLFLIVNGIHRGINKYYEENKGKYILALVGLWVISSICHLFSWMPQYNPIQLPSMNIYISEGGLGIGGGLLGGILTDVLRGMIGNVATGIVLFTALIVLIMFITKWSPVKALLRLIVRMVMEAKAKKQAEQLAIEQLMSKQTKEQSREAKEKKIADFGEDDVIRTEHKKPSGKVFTGVGASDSTQDADDEFENLPVFPWEMEHINEVVDSALGEPVASQNEPADVREDRPLAPVTHIGYEENTEDDSAISDEGTDSPRIVRPERVQGMEDVTEEIEEDIYERIPYTYPDIALLDHPGGGSDGLNSRDELRETAQKLISTLKSFNVEAKLLNVSKGPTVTRYELKPGEGVKVSKIVGLAEDITMRLAVNNVRIAPVPNKEAVGVEIPNKSIDTVHIREVIDSDEFRNFPSKLSFALGKDITGRSIVCDIGKMPHVLIAGATGSGKSVCINTLITSIVYKADPNEVKLLMIDPKVVELGIYNGIPHLLIPVVTDPRRASGALSWAVQEMTRRYNMFAEANVRDMKGYNEMILESGKENTLPHIVIIIDELADLMMVAPKEVEDSICRLAQMARAAGMHLVIATQRPSVDVITGLIKANIPSRIAFAVSSQIDSRTILDAGGAEKLLGRGDMLFSPVGAPKPTRLQGAFISDKEVERVVEFIKHGSSVRYDEDIIEKIDKGKPVNVNEPNGDSEDNDELLPRAIEIAVDSGKISASYLQRRLKIGFSRAARIIDQMEERGWIGPPEGSKPREVLITKEDYLEMSLS